jgi:hypothetical protein
MSTLGYLPVLTFLIFGHKAKRQLEESSENLKDFQNYSATHLTKLIISLLNTIFPYVYLSIHLIQEDEYVLVEILVK